MLIIIPILLACLLILVAGLLLWSPGKPTPFVDGNGSPLAGSLSEKIHVNINGVQQGMFIQSKDTTHPVLLYLHGGMPEYFLTQRYPPVWKTISPSFGGNSVVLESPIAPRFHQRR